MSELPNSDPNMSVEPFPRNDDAKPNLSVNSVELNSSNNLSSATSECLLRIPSPLPMFSSHEAMKVSERVKEQDCTSEALKILVDWLKRGNWNKANCNLFFDLINDAHTQVQGLITERNEMREAAYEERRELLKEISYISLQLNDILKVFDSAKLQKVWDCFTESQCKQLTKWIQDAYNLKSEFSDETEYCEDNEVVSPNNCFNDDQLRSPDSDTDSETNELEEEYWKLEEELAYYTNLIEICEEETAKLERELEENRVEHQKNVQAGINHLDDLDAAIFELQLFQIAVWSLENVSFPNRLRARA